MAYVNTAPPAIAAAAAQLEGIGNSFSAESAAAATPTTAIAPAASDEVSALQAGVFSTYGQLYQTVSAQAQAIHQQFTNLLQSSSGSYQGHRVGQPDRGRRILAVQRRVVGRRVARARPHRQRHLRPDGLVNWPGGSSNSNLFQRAVLMRWGTSPPPNRT